MKIQKLSLLVPCYNEAALIPALLNKLSSINLDNEIKTEIIIVNDGSTDLTDQIVQDYLQLSPTHSIKYIRHQVNQGKGAGIKSALKIVTGDVVVVMDADLEYDPTELNKLLKPITDGFADVVYGSRFRGSEAHRILFFWHTVGNKFLTFLSNLFTDLNLTDMETGYKMIRFDILKNIRLQEDRYGFEPEITAKLSRVPGIRIYEIGISYYGRTYEEGKKITWIDGMKTIYCILKYNIFSRK